MIIFKILMLVACVMAQVNKGRMCLDETILVAGSENIQEVATLADCDLKC